MNEGNGGGGGIQELEVIREVGVKSMFLVIDKHSIEPLRKRVKDQSNEFRKMGGRGSSRRAGGNWGGRSEDVCFSSLMKNRALKEM